MRSGTGDLLKCIPWHKREKLKHLNASLTRVCILWWHYFQNLELWKKTKITDFYYYVSKYDRANCTISGTHKNKGWSTEWWVELLIIVFLIIAVHILSHSISSYKKKNFNTKSLVTIKKQTTRGEPRYTSKKCSRIYSDCHWLGRTHIRPLSQKYISEDCNFDWCFDSFGFPRKLLFIGDLLFK